MSITHEFCFIYRFLSYSARFYICKFFLYTYVLRVCAVCPTIEHHRFFWFLFKELHSHSILILGNNKKNLWTLIAVNDFYKIYLKTGFCNNIYKYMSGCVYAKCCNVCLQMTPLSSSYFYYSYKQRDCVLNTLSRSSN